MHWTRAVIGVLITTIVLILACTFLATCRPCPTPAEPSSAGHTSSEQSIEQFIEQWNRLQSHERFDIAVTASNLNSYIAARITNRERATITRATIGFDENVITFDLCLRGLLLRPTAVHVTFDVQMADGVLVVTCTDWTIGYIRLPRLARRALSRRAQWRLIDRYWHIETWELSEGSLRITGFRRH